MQHKIQKFITHNIQMHYKLEIRSMERSICFIAMLALHLTPLFVNWVTSLTPRVTWCHRLRDHWNCRWSFPIGGLLVPSHYLAWLPRYWASNISGSRPWPFRVTWRHQSRDHWNRRWLFPIHSL